MSPERGDLERIVKLDGAESYLKSNGTFDVATGKVVRPIKGENESDSDFNKREAEWLKKDFAAQKIIATSVIGKPLIHIRGVPSPSDWGVQTLNLQLRFNKFYNCDGPKF